MADAFANVPMLREEFRRKMSEGSWMHYIATYLDDPPDRAEAIAFFRQAKHRLVQCVSVPKEIDTMSELDGQRFLDEHPIPRIWDLLFLESGDGCKDSDLERLRFIPELRIVRIVSDQISDEGVARLRLLRGPEILHIYSKSITDGCLRDIAEMRSLTSLDLQGSPQISRVAFDTAVRQLPLIQDVYPPWKKE